MSGALGTTGEVASRIGAALVGSPDVELTSVDTLADAREGAVTFLRDEKYLSSWGASAASAVIVSRSLHEQHAGDAFADGRPVLVADDADLALIRLLESIETKKEAAPGIHKLAYVAPSARVAESASVGPYAQVGEHTTIGEGVFVGASAVIGDECVIGDGATIREHVVMYDRSVIGAGTTLHAGVVIGADGFGYRPSEDGKSLVKVPHIGWVEIGAGVEIGANTTIDRGKFGATRVGDGTKIDNLVMIGHNCRIGRSCVICGAVGISGSVTIGDGVTIAGGAGIVDNVTIGDGATIGGQSGVIGDIEPGATILGAPARDAKKFMRNAAIFDRLDETFKKIRPLLKDAP